MLKENKQEMKLFNLTCMYLFTQMEKRLGLKILKMLIQASVFQKHVITRCRSIMIFLHTILYNYICI